jgi:hypothetical protein
MISLSTINQTLEVVLGSAPTTALRSAVSFGEHTTGSYAAKNQTASIPSTSAVTVLSAPAAGYERVVRGFSLQNIDSASATITVRLADSGTYTTLIKVTILTGYLLTYDDDGWAVINDTGSRLGVGATGATGATGPAGPTGPQGPEGGTTTLTTKGDLLSRSTSALVRLPVGTNGQYLSADSSTTSGLIWTTPPTGAPASAQYVTLALDGTLTSERVLAAGSGISITDGGANGNVTIAASGLATSTPQYVTLAATADLANERVLTAGSGISITDGGAGSTVTVAASGLATNTPSYLTLANTADLTNERAIAVSSPITGTDGGAGASYTIGLNQAAITHNNLGGLTTGDPHTQYLLESTATTAGDTLYATAASTITRLGIGSSGQVLTVSGGLPAWVTPTTDAPVGASYITLSTDATLTNERALAVSSPITGTDGGAGGSYTIGLNQAAITHNNLGGLTTGDPHTQYITKATTTTTGDILYASAANTPSRLGIGSTGQVLTVSGGIPAWATPSTGVTDHGALTGLGDDDHTQYLLKSTATTSGDMLYATGSAAITRLGIGSTGQVLTVSSGVPTWSTPSSGVTDHGLLTGLADDDHTQYTVTAPGSSSRNVIQPSGDFKPLVVKAATTQTANLFEAQLNAGTVRASIDPNGKVTGYGLDASSQAVTNVLDPVNAQDAATKTYADTKIPKSTVTTNGDLIYGTGSSAVTRLGIGSTGQVLTVSGGVPTWAAATGGVTDHGALTGLADDDHSTVYPALAPNASTRNVIQPTGDFKPLVVKGAATQTANLFEAQLNAGTVRASVDSTGKVTGYGLDASSQKITNVGTPTVSTDGVNLTYCDGKIPKTLTTTTGDMIYASAANTPARLGIGSTGQVLTVSGGIPTWAAASGGVSDHGALTGLADDDHANYVFETPGSSTRNVIQPSGDFKALILKGNATQTSNLFEAQLNAGTVRAAIGGDGMITGYGFDSSSRRIMNVADPTSAQDAATKAYADSLVGGAPVGADYIVLNSNGTLTNERVLTAGSGISISSTSTTVTIEATGGGGGGGAEGYLLYKFGIV